MTKIKEVARAIIESLQAKAKDEMGYCEHRWHVYEVGPRIEPPEDEK